MEPAKRTTTIKSEATRLPRNPASRLIIPNFKQAQWKKLRCFSETLRLLRHRDEVWRGEVASKIEAGMDSIRTGRTHSAEQVKSKMATFKRKCSKSLAAK
jgi:hypothetical protein